MAHLTIGGCRLASGKNEIPFTWCLVIDPNSMRSKKGIYQTTVRSAKERISLHAIPLREIEEHLSMLTGIKDMEWQRYREFSVSYDVTNLESQRRKNLKSGAEDRRSEISELKEFRDLETPHVIDALNLLEEAGFHELVTLYRLLLALECEDPDDLVELDLSDFGTRTTNLLKESNKIFVNRFLVYNFLFQYVVKDTEQEKIVLQRIQKLDEDSLINTVIIPLLKIMGYQNVNRVPYHGPGEQGQDIRLFFKEDEFNRRIYHGAQVKVVDIHAGSKRTQGNVSNIGYQLEIALNSEFIDEGDNAKKKIDNVMLITSGKINDLARTYLHNKYPQRVLNIIDGKKLAELIVRYQLHNEILAK
jgi:hypothetical protein